MTPEVQSLENKFQVFSDLKELCRITQGCKPFQVGKGNPPQTKEIVKSKPYVSNKKEDNSFRPLLKGSLVARYAILWDQNYYISLGEWLAEPRFIANYDAKEKIIVRQTGSSLVATLDENQFVARDNLYTIVLKETTNTLNLKYLLGLLNSKLLNWYYQNVINHEEGEALAQVKKGHLERLKIAIGNEEQQNYIQNKVNIILKAKQENPKSNTQEMEYAIDQKVYELYGLTEEEVGIVENNT
jgi:hypothetical protein